MESFLFLNFREPRGGLSPWVFQDKYDRDALYIEKTTNLNVR